MHAISFYHIPYYPLLPIIPFPWLRIAPLNPVNLYLLFPIAGVFSRDYPVCLRHQAKGIPAEDPVRCPLQVHQRRLQISGNIWIVDF